MYILFLATVLIYSKQFPPSFEVTTKVIINSGFHSFHLLSPVKQSDGNYHVDILCFVVLQYTVIENTFESVADAK